MARVATCLPPLLLVCCLGCGQTGPETYPVSGRVYYQGEPLVRGTVFFVPDEGPASAGTISSDGSFSLRAVAGRHQVGVSSIPEPPPGATPDTYDPPPALIPTHYSRPHASGLTAEVRPGERNEVIFELQ